MTTERIFDFDHQERGCTCADGLKLKYLPNLIPHDYMCPCEECKAMTAAITARNPDGSYFYTEDELRLLATGKEGK